MFAGKSSELMRRIRRYNVAQKRCLVVKYRRDTRYSSDCMSTHDKTMLPAISAETLGEVAGALEQVDVIGIDEGQFFPDLVEFCEKQANLGRIVIVAALDGTFQRKPFGHVLELVPLAEEVFKITAVCMVCKGDAHFSKRISKECDVEVIGGSDKYISVCRQCYSLPDRPATTPNTVGSQAHGSAMSRLLEEALDESNMNSNVSRQPATISHGRPKVVGSLRV